MDNFVFAVALKKNAIKLQKEYQDLVRFKITIFLLTSFSGMYPMIFFIC